MPQSNRRSNVNLRVLALSFLLIVPAVEACDFLDVSEQPMPLTADSADYSVLFIGSSYLGYNELPRMFEQLAYSVGRSVYVRERIVYGAPLKYHAEHTLTDVAIEEHDWDFVVLQGGSHRVAYPEYTSDSVLPALEVLKAKVEANNAGTRTVYMMGWAYEDGIEFQDGSTESFSEMQQKIFDNTLEWADSLDLIVAPVGWAWHELLLDETQPHYLHSADLSHPNVRGSYLSACVFVATLFGRSLTTADYYGGVPEEQAEELQQVATLVVLNDLEMWNADPVGAPGSASASAIW